MDLPSPPNSSSASDAQNSPDSATMGLPGYSHSVDGSFSSDSSDAGVGLDVGAAMAMDWSTMFWPPATFDSVVSDPTHVQDMHMEIDPQLLGVDPAAIFGQPTEPSQSLQLATPHELAGLAPLLDAFPFDFDLTRYPVKQSQEPHAVSTTFHPARLQRAKQ
ncbi:hypothetical protein BKA62DRAFT_147381 [Auriculariales sp. MPI-PUGE-AT-0066]|nr:hypothetical protein BKA62DRAFT_147381 [Auriculariales sp. MPI-PUGE-AT-0066]